MDTQAGLNHVVSGLRESAALKLQLAEEAAPTIVRAAAVITESLKSGGQVLLFGNGGSAADAQHLAAEFVGRFAMERKALPAIALTTDTSILTAVGNDYGYEHVFVRQVQALGRANDVAIGISTSGKSPNVVEAIRVAGAMGLRTFALSGNDGGPLASAAEIAVVVPSRTTARIQECHIALGHVLCELVEKALFEELSRT
jgi:D-sedoheptulose 7-phosphate isomerase